MLTKGKLNGVHVSFKIIAKELGILEELFVEVQKDFPELFSKDVKQMGASEKVRIASIMSKIYRASYRLEGEE